MKEYYVLGITHIDLAWKRGPQEMNEMLEIVLVRVLDALEQHPDFRYMIEQCAHFRNLARRRPDLVEKLRPHLHSGRLELVGAMASTLETNLPCGESLVRNQSIGLKYARETWQIQPETAWLIDTFGLHAQLPQIFRQFGFKNLVANRFGGDKVEDLFRARGLDGSEITITGVDVYSPYVRPENQATFCYRDWDGLDALFAAGDALTGPGPLCLTAITENELLVSLRQLDMIAERNGREGEKWISATPREFFAALDASIEATGRELPVLHADLNPEFTGCFSLRSPIRLHNRRAENLLLEAEKWSALLGHSNSAETIEDAWWKMAYVQFHDVFTGSHPTSTFEDVIATLGEVQNAARGVTSEVLSPNTPENAIRFVVANGLPFERKSLVVLPQKSGDIARVCDASGAEIPFEIVENEVRCLATLPPLGTTVLQIENGDSAPQTSQKTGAATIENEWIRLECDAKIGVRRLVWKATGATLLEGAGALLIAQQDNGNFQIESPAGAEVRAESGTVELEVRESAVGQTLTLSGAFPPLTWAGADSELRFEVEFSLLNGRPELDLQVRLVWKGEKTRVRLKLATPLDTGEGIYEIPFGVVTRRDYSPRGTARGEWPAQRFVAIEDGDHGLSLVNTGIAGVEVTGGTLTSTLLRAPSSEYAGMVPDASSSAHGEHAFHFSLVPYAGKWSDSGLIQRAQELNTPPQVFAVSDAPTSRSLGVLKGADAHRVVMSCLKNAEDESGDIIARFYETTGQNASATFALEGIEGGYLSDLREQEGEALEWKDGGASFELEAFEIVTLRLKGTE